MHRKNVLQPVAPQEKIVAQAEQLLLRAGRVMGLLVCFHDRLNRVAIRRALKVHRSRFCRNIKRRHGVQCMAFDLDATHQALAGVPDGRIQTCPFGATEIAVPVFVGGVYAGVLFAGPCWTRRTTRTPDSSLVIPPTRTWLADRLTMMRGVARELAALLAEPRAQDVRSGLVLQYLQDRMAEAVYLVALARHLSLSPSRARHMVKEVFGIHFSALAQSVKTQEAARLLRTTDLTVSEVSARVGIDDANYFSRIFHRSTGAAPRDYRRRHRVSP